MRNIKKYDNTLPIYANKLMDKLISIINNTNNTIDKLELYDCYTKYLEVVLLLISTLVSDKYIVSQLENKIVLSKAFELFNKYQDSKLNNRYTKDAMDALVYEISVFYFLDIFNNDFVSMRIKYLEKIEEELKNNDGKTNYIDIIYYTLDDITDFRKEVK